MMPILAQARGGRRRQGVQTRPLGNPVRHPHIAGMRAFFRSLALAVVLFAVAAVLGPWLENLAYAIRLGAMPAPTVLPVPVAGVTPSRLADTWGGARSEGRKHEGIDIFASRGTPVLAATEGIVMRVGTNRLGGQVVWVLGPGGQRHYYAHLDSYGDVRAGMRIDAGKVLGYVGNTGNAASTPPHLHYGIYTAGGAVDPYPFLHPGKTR
jgi:murein DD-endopeptidase MepM/ murein hydrolase activator NlpD